MFKVMSVLLRRIPTWLMTIIAAASAYVGWRLCFSNQIPSGTMDRMSSGLGESTKKQETSVGPPGSRESDSKATTSSANRYKQINEVKLLKALQESDHPSGLNRCGRLLKEELLRTGAYGSVGRFLTKLPKKDVKYLLNQWIIGTSTDLGPVADYDEQKWLIDDLGISNDLRLTDRLHYEAGGSAFLEIATRRPADLREARVMHMALRGSAKRNGVKATIKSLPKLVGDQASNASVKSGVESLLSSNSTEASSAIGELSPGYPKDVMIEAMIDWLAKKGERSSISPWINHVSDPSIKERLRGRTSQ
jgi:hypothetical protein